MWKSQINLQTAQKSYRYSHLNVPLWPHSIIVSGILNSYSCDIQGQFLQWSPKDKKLKILSITFKGHSEGQADKRVSNIWKRKKINTINKKFQVFEHLCVMFSCQGLIIVKISPLTNSSNFFGNHLETGKKCLIKPAPVKCSVLVGFA